MQLNVSPTSTVADVLLAGAADLECESPEGMKLMAEFTPVSGRIGGCCRGIQALGGEAILEECCGHG